MSSIRCFCDDVKDFNYHKGKSQYEDVLQSGGGPSTMTNRGHQTPSAFLILASGLDKVSVSMKQHVCQFFGVVVAVAVVVVAKVQGIIIAICYCTAHMRDTCHQQCFTVSEVAADWHEPVVPQCIMWPSIVRANRQLDPWCSYQTHHCSSQPH